MSECGSLDVHFEGLDRAVGLTSAAILEPVPIRRDAWQCHACGARWQELPDESDANRSSP
jgi:hypothetical protein